MRAVLYTGGTRSWAEALGDRPWALLPFGGRPLLSYWLELCVDLGISDVQLVLGHDAEFVEMFCGTGERWGLNINYSLIRAEDRPHSYLARDPQRWRNGLLYVGAAVFPRRTADFRSSVMPGLLRGCCVCDDGTPAVFVGTGEQDVDHFIRAGNCSRQMDCLDPCEGDGPCRTPDAVGIDFTLIRDVQHYYQLNMELVRAEMKRYVSGGYTAAGNASIGSNVIIPASVTLTPPLAIGNDCRLGALAAVGPSAVISDHVLIDRQCEIADSIILSDTYIGRNLEIKGKIVAGNRILDPDDGTWVDIEDPWLVAQTRSRYYLRDVLRAVIGWEITLVLMLIQILPFLLLYALIRLLSRGRFVSRSIHGVGGNEIKTPLFVPARREKTLLLLMFYALALDRFPWLFQVLAGRLWLCGQVPRAADEPLKDPRRYFPAVFSYADAFAEIDKQMDALYYAHTRSLAADLRILRHVLFTRLIEVELISDQATESRI